MILAGINDPRLNIGFIAVFLDFGRRLG